MTISSRAIRNRVSAIGVVMFLAAVSIAAGQLKPPAAQDEELVTETIHYTQRVRLTICCGPGGSISASASKPVLRHAKSVNRSSFSNCDPRAGELVLLSKLLLTERGTVEIDSRLKTFTIIDRRAAVESIRRLVESHALRSSSIRLTDPDDAKSSAAIRAVLDAQAGAWNRGDIEGYMDGYDRSRSIGFILDDRFSSSWQDRLERYKKTYDTREKMGVLTFSEVEVAMVSQDAALVLGRWHLQRIDDEPHGLFTLLFKRTKDGWRIVYDQTSSA